MRRGVCALALGACAVAQPSQNSYDIAIGFMGDQFVQVSTLNRTSGTITPRYSVNAGNRTAWMVPSSDGRFLYVANHDSVRLNGAGVTVLNITNPGTGVQLVYNSFSSTVYERTPNDPVHLVFVDYPGADWGTPVPGSALFSVSYTNGDWTTWMVNADGSLTINQQYINACYNPHQIIVAPLTKYAGSSGADKALSLIVPCKGQRESSQPSLGDIEISGTGAGCTRDTYNTTVGNFCYQGGPGQDGRYPDGQNPGPRHGVFHPFKGDTLYMLNELDSTIAIWGYDSRQPKLTLFPGTSYRMSSLPPGYTQVSEWAAAEILVHPNTRFLFVSNRAIVPAGTPITQPSDPAQRIINGSNVGVYAIDARTGFLTPLAWYDAGGEANSANGGLAHPRHMAISPDGLWLVVANMNAGTLTVFRINPATGALTFNGFTSTGTDLNGGLSAPAFVLFFDKTTYSPASGAHASAHVAAATWAALVVGTIFAAAAPRW